MPPPENLEILVTLAPGNTSASSTPAVSSGLPRVSTRGRNSLNDQRVYGSIMFEIKLNIWYCLISDCKVLSVQHTWLMLLHE